jgi:hypothetical protein
LKLYRNKALINSIRQYTKGGGNNDDHRGKGLHTFFLKKILSYSVLLFLLCIYGCGPSLIDVHKKQGVDLGRYERIAVLKFSSPNLQAGIEAADLVALQLLRKGYSVIERLEIDKILREQEFGLTGAVDPQKAAEIGRILGVQCFVIGAVGTYKTTQMFVGTIQVSKSSASITVKMIDVKDAAIIWMAGGSYTVHGNNPAVPLKELIVGIFKKFSK